LLVLGLLVTTADGQNAGTGETEDLIIEEVLVTGSDYCGAWPIAHHLSTLCHYPELKRGRLDIFRKMRARKFSDCLVCEGSTCTLKVLAASAATEKLVCTRLFLSPRHIARLSVRITDSSRLIVDYSYGISTSGRVKDIHISYLDSDLSEETVLDLLIDGAKETRFEPLRFNGSTFELVGLQDGFTLEEY